MYATHSVRSSEIHDYAHGVLADFLKVKNYGKKCSASTLVSLLLFAATQAASLTAACRRLAGAPSDETVRKALLATLPGYQALQRQINAALAHPLPKALRKRPWPKRPIPGPHGARSAQVPRRRRPRRSAGWRRRSAGRSLGPG